MRIDPRRKVSQYRVLFQAGDEIARERKAGELRSATDEHVKWSNDTADTVSMPSLTFQIMSAILAGLGFLVVTFCLQVLATHAQVTRQRQVIARNRQQPQPDAADTVNEPGTE